MTIFNVNKRKYTNFCSCKKTRQIKETNICRATSKMIEFNPSDARCPIQNPIVVFDSKSLILFGISRIKRDFFNANVFCELVVMIDDLFVVLK